MWEWQFISTCESDSLSVHVRVTIYQYMWEWQFISTCESDSLLVRVRVTVYQYVWEWHRGRFYRCTYNDTGGVAAVDGDAPDQQFLDGGGQGLEVRGALVVGPYSEPIHTIFKLHAYFHSNH